MDPEPQRQVPSLFSLALAQAAVNSPNSRAALDDAAQAGHLDAGIMAVVNEAELAHLVCCGRVPTETQSNPFFPFQTNVVPPNPQGRHPGLLDARLDSYCDEMDELTVPLDQLQQWLREQGVRMTWRRIEYDAEGNEIDV